MEGIKDEKRHRKEKRTKETLKIITIMRAREAEPFKILACLWTIPPKHLSEKIKACIKSQNIGSGLFPQQAE